VNSSKNILTLEGYYARFDELHVEYQSQNRAWMELEKELMENFGLQRYTSLESFKSARSRRFKAKRKSRDIFR